MTEGRVSQARSSARSSPTLLFQVPVDRYEMPLEDRSEQHGIIVRPGDDLGVRRDPQRYSSLPWYCPKSLGEFSLTQECQRGTTLGGQRAVSSSPCHSRPEPEGTVGHRAVWSGRP